jgi:ABC-type multidrug transport system ATPase subunit
VSGARVSVEHLTRTFGPVTVIDDVSMAVASGETVGLTGVSGSGSS